MGLYNNEVIDKEPQEIFPAEVAERFAAAHQVLTQQQSSQNYEVSLVDYTVFSVKCWFTRRLLAIVRTRSMVSSVFVGYDRTQRDGR